MAEYHPEKEMIWLGDLSGYQVEAISSGLATDGVEVMLTHRCGFLEPLHTSDQYLGNIIEKALAHRKETCVPYRNKKA